MITKGCLTKLLANAVDKSYMGCHEPEIIMYMKMVVSTVWMEEALQQQQEAEI